MQNFNPHQLIFVPNYPPPIVMHQSQPWPSNQLVSPSRLNLFQERLETYVKQKCTVVIVRKASDKKTNDVKLSYMKQDLSNGFKTIEQLKHKRDQLIANRANSNQSDWQSQIDDIQKLKKSLVDLSTKFNGANYQNAVQAALNRRREKRSRIKKRKEMTKQWKMSLAKEKMRRNNRIDDWLQQNNETILDERRKIDAAKRAEQVLSGVTRKKTEAKRYIELLNSLVELRRVRVVQSGKYDNGQEEFAAKIGQLNEIWLDAIENYDREERELNKLVNSDEAIIDDWYETLFGTSRAVDQRNPMLKGEYNLNELVKIRRVWDQCIVPLDYPFGSTIPIGWVLPNPKPTEKWAKYKMETKSQDELETSSTN